MGLEAASSKSMSQDMVSASTNELQILGKDHGLEASFSVTLGYSM